MAISEKCQKFWNLRTTRQTTASVNIGCVFAPLSLKVGHLPHDNLRKKAFHIGKSTTFWLDDGGQTRNN